ncbi:hypothetical protein V6O07_17250, partial [Arthrospira platensis SPKY2]
SRSDDPDLYRDAYDEAQRIIRISDEVRISLEKVGKDPDPPQTAAGATIAATTAPKEGEGKTPSSTAEPQTAKLTTSKLAQKLKIKTPDALEKLIAVGYLEL